MTENPIRTIKNRTPKNNLPVPKPLSYFRQIKLISFTDFFRPLVLVMEVFEF